MPSTSAASLLPLPPEVWEQVLQSIFGARTFFEDDVDLAAALTCSSLGRSWCRHAFNTLELRLVQASHASFRNICHTRMESSLLRKCIYAKAIRSQRLEAGLGGRLTRPGPFGYRETTEEGVTCGSAA